MSLLQRTTYDEYSGQRTGTAASIAKSGTADPYRRVHQVHMNNLALHRSRIRKLAS